MFCLWDEKTPAQKMSGRETVEKLRFSSSLSLETTLSSEY